MPKNGITKQVVTAAVQKLLHTMPAQATSTADSTFVTWQHRAEAMLIEMLGKDHPSVAAFESIIWHSMMPFTSGTSRGELEGYSQGAFRSGLAQARAVLDGVLSVVELWPDAERKAIRTHARTSRVFLVHGHDGGLKNTVARYIALLGLNAVILHEQPDRGRTVIEKFEQEAKCDYAVVLATGDDLAASVKQMRVQGGKEADGVLQHRARQNVVFELGFLVGKLGRDRVMLIADSGVEMPSDLAGVVWSSRSEWTSKLAQELDAAQMPIDHTKVLAAIAIRE